MARVQLREVILSPSGDLMSGISALIKLPGTSTPATLYEAETGGTTVANPLTSIIGEIDCWIDEGSYDVTYSGTGITTNTERLEVQRSRPTLMKLDDVPDSTDGQIARRSGLNIWVPEYPQINLHSSEFGGYNADGSGYWNAAVNNALQRAKALGGGIVMVDGINNGHKLQTSIPIKIPTNCRIHTTGYEAFFYVPTAGYQVNTAGMLFVNETYALGFGLEDCKNIGIEQLHLVGPPRPDPVLTNHKIKAVALQTAVSTSGANGHASNCEIEGLYLENWAGPQIHLINCINSRVDEPRLIGGLRGGIIVWYDSHHITIDSPMVIDAHDDCIAFNARVNTGSTTLPTAQALYPHDISVDGGVLREYDYVAEDQTENTCVAIRGARNIQLDGLQMSGATEFSELVGVVSILNEGDMTPDSIHIKNCHIYGSGSLGVNIAPGYKTATATYALTNSNWGDVVISDCDFYGGKKDAIQVRLQQKSGDPVPVFDKLTLQNNRYHKVGADSSQNAINIVVIGTASPPSGILRNLSITGERVYAPAGRALNIENDVKIRKFVLDDIEIYNPHRVDASGVEPPTAHESIDAIYIAPSVSANGFIDYGRIGNIKIFNVNDDGTSRMNLVREGISIVDQAALTNFSIGNGCRIRDAEFSIAGIWIVGTGGTIAVEPLNDLGRTWLNVASASTLVLTGTNKDASYSYQVTGTTNITQIAGGAQKQFIVLKFSSALTVVNGSNIHLSGSDFVTAAGRTLSLWWDGTDAWEISRYGSTFTLPTGAIVGTTDTQTLTNKRITLRQPGSSLTDAATVTPDSDSYDAVYISELSQATTIANPTGAPTAFQSLIIRVKSTTSRALSWGTQYRASVTNALPASTSGSGKWDYLSFRWNAVDSKWDLVGADYGH